jgi:hypothetical protein
LCLRSIQSEQQTIIALSWGINGFLVDQNRVHHSTDFHQLLPIPAVARKARYFSGGDGAYLAQTDLGHHALEASPRHCASSGGERQKVGGGTPSVGWGNG